jgi:flagellar basal-body rod modification protein FlgD
MANTLDPVSSSGATGGSTTTTGSNPPPANKLVNQNMFLQLMIAQLRNQDPLNPANGTEFLTQLSQISGVEQLVQVNQQATQITQQLDAIRKALTPTPTGG